MLLEEFIEAAVKPSRNLSLFSTEAPLVNYPPLYGPLNYLSRFRRRQHRGDAGGGGGGDGSGPHRRTHHSGGVLHR